ncbi:MAG: copper homeostasis protein CutC [Prevotellaceae bacterium]|jgi:copper homeostasis protein|nr:copper homeostasis protein CutC [Prevotellaceae bacterium]
MSDNKYEVEVCAGLVQSAVEAERGGASRVELCANLFEGGTTPSAATIEMSCSMVGIPIYVIIRPRGGDFLYSDLEFETMKRDVVEAKKYGASGIATGILLPDGSVDERRTGELVDIAHKFGMGATFHRAFDMTANPAKALEAVIRTGCERILTSGGRNKAFDGRLLIGQLVQQAAGRISLMAGSGVNPENVAELVESTGAREVHVSGKHRVEGGMKFRNTDIMMGGLPGIPEYEIDVTDAETVRRIVDRLSGLNRTR